MFVTDILEKYEHGDNQQKSHVLFDELKKLKARELKNKEIIFSTASREDLDKISNDTKPKNCYCEIKGNGDRFPLLI